MKLKETITDVTLEGIFFALADIGSITLITTSNKQTLNMEYYLNHSGEKTISPMYDTLWTKEHDGETLPDTAIKLMAKTIALKYTDKWNRLYSAYVTETYNPLENYDMEEDENVGSKITSTSSGSVDSYGFNSDDAVGNNVTGNSATTEGAYNDNKRKLTRHGNIGVTTSQQMLQSEIELRKYVLYNEVYNDIDHELCRGIYI